MGDGAADAPGGVANGPLVLPMLRSDVRAVALISETVFPVPWSRQEFEKEIERDYAHARVLRAASGQPVCAFVNYWIVAGELQIMNVATLPMARRRGYAHAMLSSVLEEGRRAGLSRALLEVRRSSEAAIALYSRLGFRSLGVRPGYYSDNAEDAVVMELTLSAPPPTTAAP